MNASRRAFLTRGSLGVALAGAAAMMPGLSAVLKLPAPSLTAPALPATAEPLVAHVRDLASGEVVGDFPAGEASNVGHRTTALQAKVARWGRAFLFDDREFSRSWH